MENGIWEGKLIVAAEISRKYESEKKIRKASACKELRCPDSECSHPIIKYCHGDKRGAFFSHLINDNCDYAVFDKIETSRMKELRRKMYEQFICDGYTVYPEQKLLKHHYSHFFFKFDHCDIVVEVGTKNSTVHQVEKLNQEYWDAGLNVNWVVADNAKKHIVESQTFFLKRFILNEARNKSLLVIDWNGVDVAQYMIDKLEYFYEEENGLPAGISDTYQEISTIEHLTFHNGELSIYGFEKRYRVWKQEREEKYKRIIEMKNLNNIEEKRTENIQKKYISQDMAPSYDELKEEILPYIDQQKEQVHDSINNRWIRCEICNRIDMDVNFSSYGGKNHVNLGRCKKCSKY